jgi:hypothetical protein
MKSQYIHIERLYYYYRICIGYICMELRASHDVVEVTIYVQERHNVLKKLCPAGFVIQIKVTILDIK